MSSILKSYIRGLRQIATMPPEKMAVPSASPFARNIGQSTGRETASEIQRGTQRTASEYELESEKKDIDLAKSDTAVATGIEAANVALRGLTARDRMILSAKEAEDARIRAEQMDMLVRELKGNRETYRNLLTPENPTGAIPNTRSTLNDIAM